MTVSTTNIRDSHVGNGVIAAFAYTFQTVDSGTVDPYLDEVLQTSGFTVTPQVEGIGGIVNFSVPPGPGVNIVIVRMGDYIQQQDYQPNDPFPAEANEGALDLAALERQELLDGVARAITTPITDDPGVGTDLPVATERGNKIFAFDNAGDTRLINADAGLRINQSPAFPQVEMYVDGLPVFNDVASNPSAYWVPLSLIGFTHGRIPVSELLSGGSGGGHVIQDEGVSLPNRANLDFTGGGVVVSDDGVGDKSVVSISGTGGPAYAGGVAISIDGGNNINSDPTKLSILSTASVTDWLTWHRASDNMLFRATIQNLVDKVVTATSYIRSTLWPSADQASLHTNIGLGNAAVLDTGTTAGTVAAGDHLHTGIYSDVGHNHDASYAAISHVADDARHLLTDERDALTQANMPSVSNAIATIADIVVGSGDVTGPAGGVVNQEIAVYSGTTGKVIQGSSGLLLTNFLQNVVDDTTPTLGGPLETDGNDIVIRRADTTELGRILADDTDTLSAFGYFPGGVYDQDNGAIGVGPGEVIVHGSNVNVPTLSNPENRQVWVDIDGNLFAVAGQEAGWSEPPVTSSIDQNLGAGTGVGSWFPVTGLISTLPSEHTSGDKVVMEFSVQVVNLSLIHAGTIDVGYGINGANPIGFVSEIVVGGFDGTISDSISVISLVADAGDTISVFARNGGGDHVQYEPTLVGSGIRDHHFHMSSGHGTSVPPTTMFSDSTTEITTGYTHQHEALGTLPAATLDLDFQQVNFKVATMPATGTVTIGVPSNNGSCVLKLTNDASAGSTLAVDGSFLQAGSWDATAGAVNIATVFRSGTERLITWALAQ